MSSYTPGPWKSFIRGKVVEVQDISGKSIVKWTGFDASDRPLKEQRANAKLIAAAPELLAVAESNLALIKSVYDLRLGDGSLPFNTIDYYAIEQLIADTETAIAAAKGVTQ